MGLFDYVYSSYDLGEGFTRTELQTKSLQDDLGGFFERYWIDPIGRLFLVDYSGTQEPIREENGTIWPVTYVPTGAHGVVTPINWTGTMKVINEHGDRSLLFFQGRVIDNSSDKYSTCPVCHSPIYIPDRLRNARTATHCHH